MHRVCQMLVLLDSLEIENAVAAQVRLRRTDESYRYRHGDVQGTRRREGRQIEPTHITLDLTACDDAPLRFWRSHGAWTWQAKVVEAERSGPRLFVTYELELC